MAYPKYSSLALIALVLVATASLANCQLNIPSIPVVNSAATVVGIVTCNIVPLPLPPLVGVNVILSCDGGRTQVGPTVPADSLGLFFIPLSGANATVVNTARCAAFVRTNVPGCPTLRPGEVLRAPLIELNQALPIFSILRLFLAAFFSVARVV